VNVTDIRNKQVFAAITYVKHVFLSNLGRMTRYLHRFFALFVSNDDTRVLRINNKKKKVQFIGDFAWDELKISIIFQKTF